MTISLLTELQVDELKMSLNGCVPQTMACRLRGCHADGEFFLRRRTRHGGVQEGLYCSEHEELFGMQNLKLWARELGKMLVIQIDAEGQFIGVEL